MGDGFIGFGKETVSAPASVPTRFYPVLCMGEVWCEVCGYPAPLRDMEFIGMTDHDEDPDPLYAHPRCGVYLRPTRDSFVPFPERHAPRNR